MKVLIFAPALKSGREMTNIIGKIAGITESHFNRRSRMVAALGTFSKLSLKDL